MQGAAVTLTELGEYSRAAAFLEKLAKVCFCHAFIFHYVKSFISQ